MTIQGGRAIYLSYNLAQDWYSTSTLVLTPGLHRELTATAMHLCLFPFLSRFIKIIHTFDIVIMSRVRSNYFSFVCFFQGQQKQVHDIKTLPPITNKSRDQTTAEYRWHYSFAVL